jgi:hypothetical protein
MPKFKIIKNLEENLKKVENETPTNCFGRWFKTFRIREINRRICSLKDSVRKK